MELMKQKGFEQALKKLTVREDMDIDLCKTRKRRNEKDYEGIPKRQTTCRCKQQKLIVTT
jgi:hypothetical protein